MSATPACSLTRAAPDSPDCNSRVSAEPWPMRGPVGRKLVMVHGLQPGRELHYYLRDLYAPACLVAKTKGPDGRRKKEERRGNTDISPDGLSHSTCVPPFFPPFLLLFCLPIDSTLSFPLFPLLRIVPQARLSPPQSRRFKWEPDRPLHLDRLDQGLARCCISRNFVVLLEQRSLLLG